MEANFVLSQKGTNSLKDDEIERSHNREDLKAMCASLSFDSVPLNKYLLNFASLFTDE